MLHPVRRKAARVFALLAGLALSAAAAAAQAPSPGPFDPPADSEPAKSYAAAAGDPVPLSPLVVRAGVAVNSAGAAAQQASLGATLCLDSFQGLPGPGETGGRPIILWQCHGRDNQNVVLSDGVLFIGADRTHRIEPMPAPTAGCDWRETSSLKRRYAIGVCRDGETRVERIADFPDAESARLASRAPPAMPGFQPGAPLVAIALSGGGEPRALWEYLPRTKQLRLVGANLCLTTPSQDLTDGAPVYLDDCIAPFQIDPADRHDDARRDRVEFNRYWR